MQTELAITEYLGLLRDRGLSTHTLRAYAGDLKGLAAMAEHLGGPGDESVLADFAASLLLLPTATRRRRLSALSGFVSWAAARGIITAGPLGLGQQHTGASLSPAPPAPAPRTPVPTAPAPRAPGPSADEVAAALRQIPRQADRDQLLFGLMARLGLRPGEALALRAGDVDTDLEVLTVTGWGGRVRRVVIDDREVLQRLRNLLRAGGEASTLLFPSPVGPGPLRYQSMAERWSGYAASAGVAVTPGDLRRAHAAELLAGGMPEWIVRNRLGQATGQLPGTGGTAAEAEAAVRAWQQNRTAADGGRRTAARRGQPEPDTTMRDAG
jgi:integrase/recombinase XerD